MANLKRKCLKVKLMPRTLADLALNDAENVRLKMFLTETSRAVEAKLDAWMPQTAQHDGAMHGIDRVAECMRYSLFAGGKRLRPALVRAAYVLAGGAESDRALWTGAAMEMIHTYSLIQDDMPMMDNDDLRRGRPTAHKQFDDVTALMASDGLQTGAYELLAAPEIHDDPAVRIEIIRLFARSSGGQGMVAGQQVDMMWETEGLGVGLADLSHMNLLKTGMNITACCEAGAVLADADMVVRKDLVAYGTALGRSYQIYDDVLDVTGTAEELGKTPGKDAAAGKTTFVSLLELEGAQAKALDECETALAALAQYGEEADILRLIARYCVTRSN
jgi:farnesyl diphosphate synthase